MTQTQSKAQAGIKPPFHKILIANRGEIACRVIRTAKHLGIRTVAVYSDADVFSPHVQMADEAYRLGPAPSAESYLQTAKIIEICQKSGVEAVHPGYGFLSENAAFAIALEEAGIRFIGPNIEAIEAMGSKSAAKALMEKAYVPTLPGYHGTDQSPAHLQSVAEKIGFPVLIKAVAGGGGRGMRRVDSAAEFAAALESAKREAKAGFGNDDVLVEKFLTAPRHIEVQVFGDKHGNVVHLFERDCSIQRRHQKVLEEAPAPMLDAGVRDALCAAGVRAAEAVHYVGAGTVEFLLDGVGKEAKFYFMEMNTRLQVEHPVTEYITGEDLVAWQIRVAAGDVLPRQQSEIRCHGHAIEARVCAEDVEHGFLPSSGPLKVLSFPTLPQVRVDTGVEQGGEVSTFYDSMIAKVIAYGETREEALYTLEEALRQTVVHGLACNVGFLSRACVHPAFLKGGVTTHFLEGEGKDLLPQPVDTATEAHLALAAWAIWRKRMAAHKVEQAYNPSPWHRASGWKLNAPEVQTLVLEGQVVQLMKQGENLSIQVKKSVYPVEGEKISQGGVLLEGYAWSDEKRVISVHEGQLYVFAYEDDLRADAVKQTIDGALSAPIPGTITKVMAEAGMVVSKGTPLLVMEAMKMEHTITAPSDGTVEKVHFEAGQKVDEGVVLITFEASKKEEAA